MAHLDVHPCPPSHPPNRQHVTWGVTPVGRPQRSCKTVPTALLTAGGPKGVPCNPALPVRGSDISCDTDLHSLISQEPSPLCVFIFLVSVLVPEVDCELFYYY